MSIPKPIQDEITNHLKLSATCAELAEQHAKDAERHARDAKRLADLSVWHRDCAERKRLNDWIAA